MFDKPTKMGKVGGFMVSLWGVLPFDSVWNLRLNEKLEMRNPKWWCGTRSFDSVLTVPPLHYRTSDILLRSGWRNAPRSINNGDAMSWHASHLRHLIPSHSSLATHPCFQTFLGYPFPVSSSRTQPRDRGQYHLNTGRETTPWCYVFLFQTFFV